MDPCHSLADIRAQIDRLDRLIVPLLAERARLVEHAPRFKATKHQVVDPDRIEQVVLKVRHMANEEGIDPDLIEKIYRAMMDAFIVHEAQFYRTLHQE